MSATSDRRKSAPRIKFEKPLQARAMAIDGTSCRDCLLIDISESGARIELVAPAGGLEEFFLLLSNFGNPVFRRCKREWVDGVLMGVTFHTDRIGMKPLKEVRRDSALV
jgi:hypothetical protein